MLSSISASEIRQIVDFVQLAFEWCKSNIPQADFGISHLEATCDMEGVILFSWVNRPDTTKPHRQDSLKADASQAIQSLIRYQL